MHEMTWKKSIAKSYTPKKKKLFKVKRREIGFFQLYLFMTVSLKTKFVHELILLRKRVNIKFK